MAALRLVVSRSLLVLGSVAIIAACGSSAGSMSDGVSGAPDGGEGSDAAVAGDVTQGVCRPGEQLCSSCNGGVFCTPSCPQIGCPGMSDGGTFDAGEAEGGACAAGQVPCLDCSGGRYCVSGACPVTTCPVQDAGGGGPSPNDGAVRSDSNAVIPDGGPGPLCPGASPPPAGYPLCRSNADCKLPQWPLGGTCSAQPASGCGGTSPGYRQCNQDSDCADAGTRICEPTIPPAGSCMTPGTLCMPRCQATTCTPDTQCAASGRCQPTPCGANYTCPADLVCKPSDPNPDAHGCSRKSCTAGFTCPVDQECNATATTADAHGCVPTPCSNGYACDALSRCLAGPSADAHGCSPIPCSNTSPCGVNESCDPTQPGRGCVQRKCVTDSDCDCGACVQSYCESRLWVCSANAQ